MFLFVLDADVRLKMDQARIILRFHSFPNGAFELVQFQPIIFADTVAKPLLFQGNVSRMHDENLVFRILARDDLRHLI